MASYMKCLLCLFHRSIFHTITAWTETQLIKAGIVLYRGIHTLLLQIIPSGQRTYLRQNILLLQVTYKDKLGRLTTGGLDV